MTVMFNAPSAIKLHNKSNKLEVIFNDRNFQLPAEYLRVYSPSAEVRGHGPGEEVLQLNKEDVAIIQIEPQGNYAIRLFFSDGHDSGIYSWQYLYELGSEYQQKWQTYQEAVKAHKVQQEEQETSTVRWIDPKSPNH